ncbi:MAG TPA: enoyl-CoA hydratase [Hyphomicrobiaceae bacterium]|jgi:enoyl-CoA hydratase/carnithine racemase|nr:enoyl-CoA hydratase [Hyphomicrobiaceae bacterium]
MQNRVDDDLRYEVRDGIGLVTFNRPAALNALTFEMYDRLGEICGEVRLGGAVKAIIITGAGGRAFGAGTDISLFQNFATAQEGIDYEARMERMFAKLERCPVPTIAAIAGVCTGGAAVIAAACDLRIASRQLKYGFPIARTLANCLSAANIARVALLTGVGRALDLLLTTRLIGADEALAIGLVNELCDTPEALLERARALGAQMATQAPLTMLAGKEVVRRMRANFAGIDDRDLIELCYGSRDFREGLSAFLAKRAPKFTAQ